MVLNSKEQSAPLTEIEHSAFCTTEDQLKPKPLEDELKVNVRWQNIPDEYINLGVDELDERILTARQNLGAAVTILGHHYQREEVIKYADFQGDSFKLSQQAASQDEADYIVFCGVHFMAETACVLCKSNQQVILPNIAAGCSMADMAPTDDVIDAWDDLMEVSGEGSVIPVTYMNSTADIKALCGKNGGIVCTSSNAAAVFEWAFKRGDKVLFIPDQHLGRNTALEYGIGLDEMTLWNPFKPLGGLTIDRINKSKVLLWRGHCSVHTRFTVGQINRARERHPDVNIIVHPECIMDVVEAADFKGSTEVIIKTINDAPSGTKWGVGTEISLVNRIARNNPDKFVFCLDPVVCPCSTMYRIHPAYLAWVLEGLTEGQVVNRITVDENTHKYAAIALERMLQIQ